MIHPDAWKDHDYWMFSWDEMAKDAGDGMPGWLAAKVRQLNEEKAQPAEKC